MLGTISIWSLLGIAILLAGLRGLIPLRALLVALVLVPLSGFAAGNITDLISHGDDANWLVIVHVAVPPLLALYLAWAVIPGFHAALSPRMAGAIVWIAVLVLSALPWPQVIALPGLQQKRYDDWQAHRDALFARFNELATNGSVEG